MSITGSSPSKFIRIIRLKKSLKLLEKTQMTVAEVAYKVGFNTPKIFTHYFKEEYKMTPTEYRKKKKHPLMKRNSNFLDFLLPAYHYKVVTYCGTTCTESTRTTEPLENQEQLLPANQTGRCIFRNGRM